MKAILAFLCLFIILFSSCSHESTTESKNETYRVITPLIMDTVFVSEYVAEIHSLQNVELRARIKGYIDKILVDEGEKVKAGQVLFKISDQHYREELNMASAQLKLALAEGKLVELSFNDTKMLIEKNVVSNSQLEVGQTKMLAAKARIEEAKSREAGAELNLSYTEIKAPFDGVINRIPFKIGSLIDEGSLLTTISNNCEVFAYFNVSEREYLEIIKREANENSNLVKLILANNEPYFKAGKIETVEGEFDQSSGNIAYRARFENPNEVLKHGSSGKIQLYKELKNAMIIPQKSTIEIQEKNYVFVLDKDNVVHMKSFVPKLRLTNFYVVESGLSSTDKIIYEGIQLIKEGDKIVPQIVSKNELLSNQAK